MTDRLAPGAELVGRDDTRGLVIDYQKLVSATAAIFVFCGAIAIIEPSPYDFASLVAMPLWFLGGFTIHRSFVLFAALLLGFTATGFLALIPYWDNADSALYMYQSAYLTLTSLYFALFVGNRTKDRLELIFKAYAGAALLASFCGVLGYFSPNGVGALFNHYGRASGTFKDPNVLGSFVILGGVYLAQNLVLMRTRRIFLSALFLAIIVAGVFLSFSRGSWGAFIFSFLLMIGAAYFTSTDARMKRRIAAATLVAGAVAVIVVLILLSMAETREFFLQRASVTQDYDEGSTGRFGNQLRSIPMLLERFGGFGPLRFRLVFNLEPHNSYIGAFANGGWIGGFLFILIVCVSSYVGFRLMFRPSPYQRQAQVLFPALLAFFLQAFQIDIDHWRHVLLMLGSLWGLEAGRQKWEDQQSRVPRNAGAKR